MLYGIAQVLISIFARIFFRLRVEGAEGVPPEGGIVLASNHLSYWDIPLLACTFPRPISFMGKAELFRVPLIGRLFWTLGGFPVRRGEADRHAMGEAIRRLQEGRVVAMFPEGTRSRDGRLGRGKPGIGMIVAHSGAKVVPVYVRGTQEWYRFPRITIRFGPAVDFAPAIRQIGEEKRGVVYERMAQRIMEAIEKLA